MKLILELHVKEYNKDLKGLSSPISSLVLSVYFSNPHSVVFPTLCELWRQPTALIETTVSPSGSDLFRSIGKIKLLSVWETSLKVHMCKVVEVGQRVHQLGLPLPYLLHPSVSDSFRKTGIYTRLKCSFHDFFPLSPASCIPKSYQVCFQLLFWSPLLLPNHFYRSSNSFLPNS